METLLTRRKFLQTSAALLFIGNAVEATNVLDTAADTLSHGEPVQNSAKDLIPILGTFAAAIALIAIPSEKNK